MVRCFICVCLVWVLGLGSAWSQAIEAYEQPNLGAEMDLALTVSGPDVLGDHIDIGTGSLSFRHVDVSLPGNSALPVAFARSYTIDGINYARTDTVSVLGGWNIDIPFIAARVRDTATDTGWQNNRCTGPIRPTIDADPEFNDTLWGGARLFPGDGGGQLILESVVPGSTVYGAALPDKVTTEHWRIDCGPMLTNGPGEGFEATSPEGWTYTFDNLFITEQRVVQTGAAECGDPFCPDPDPFESNHLLPTVYWVIRASEITDVHGNWVRFVYDGNNRLTRIHANDGRDITVSYNASGQISTVSAHGRTWTYSYAGAWPVLDRVTLPDATYWEFDLPQRTTFVPGFDCSDSAPSAPTVRDTHTVRHPNGVLGTFELGIVRHGRNNVPSTLDPYRSGNDVAWVNWDTRTIGFKICNDYLVRPQNNALAVLSKTLDLPSGVSHDWSFWYEQDNGHLNHPGAPASLDLKKRIVTDPLGQETAYYYNRRYGSQIEGQLVRTELMDGSTIVESVETGHIASPSFGSSTLALTREQPDTVFTRESSSTLIRNGETYTTTRQYDTSFTSSTYSYGRPTSVTRSSTVQAGSRTQLTTYVNRLAHWRPALTGTITENGVETRRYHYDSLGRMTREDRFGALYAQYGYHNAPSQASGQLAWVEDALTRRAQATHYRRGIPQTVTRTDSVVITRVVDDHGQVTSQTDGRGTTLGFSYDAAGRITLIDRPAGFDDTTISYADLASGVTQTITQGSLRTIIEHDALFRPTREERRAIARGGGSIFTRYEYDGLGRTSFVSFPSTSANPTTGVETEYDRLGRVTRTRENVSPFAATDTAYLSDNRVRVTDPSGNITTTWRSGWGAPDDGEATRIDHPLGLRTDMTHDAWGNLLTARQHGSHSGFTVDETQSWAYDSRQRLCRHVTPETGATLYRYDAANQRIAIARGQAAGAACGSASAGQEVDYSYDLLGRIDIIDYPDASPDIDYDYDANSNLTRAARGTAVWTYSYDVMDQLTNETLVIDGRTYATGYGYTSNGQRDTQTTPGGRSVSYAPDGHGRPTRTRVAGFDYASGAVYHPSGVLTALTYGNGFALSASVNARQQISAMDVSNGALKALHYVYSYDANGRVSFIDNIALTAPNRDHSYTYDGLGRLSTATGEWGAGSFTYDLLNNLRTKTLGPDVVEIEYNAANRISRTRDTRDGNVWRTYGHDARGNVLDNSRLQFTYDRSEQPTAISGAATASFVYDAHHRRVKQTINGETIYSVYGMSGTLLYRDNVTQNHTTDYLRLGSRPVARIQNWGGLPVNYIHADHLGSSAAATKPDGAVRWREHYTPFGEQLNDNPHNRNDEAFTGHITDYDTGLTYMQARYYDPVIGRFLSSDPVGFAQGGPGYFNRYAYTANDPVNHTDPTGMQAVPAGAGRIQTVRLASKCVGSTAGAAVCGAGAALAIASVQNARHSGNLRLDLTPPHMMNDNASSSEGSTSVGQPNRHESRGRSPSEHCIEPLCDARHGGVTGTGRCTNCEAKHREQEGLPPNWWDDHDRESSERDRRRNRERERRQRREGDNRPDQESEQDERDGN